jgi:hypothetical protein
LRLAAVARGEDAAADDLDAEARVEHRLQRASLGFGCIVV